MPAPAAARSGRTARRHGGTGNRLRKSLTAALLVAPLTLTAACSGGDIDAEAPSVNVTQAISMSTCPMSTCPMSMWTPTSTRRSPPAADAMPSRPSRDRFRHRPRQRQLHHGRPPRAAAGSAPCEHVRPRIFRSPDADAGQRIPYGHAGDVPAADAAAAGPGPLTIPEVVDVVQPSVVTVLIGSGGGGGGGGGNGVVDDDKDTIITNEQVIRGADEILLAFADGRQRSAKVVAADPVVDGRPARRRAPSAPDAHAGPRRPRAAGRGGGAGATVTGGNDRLTPSLGPCAPGRS